MLPDSRPMPLGTPPTYVPTEDRHLRELAEQPQRTFDIDTVPDHDRLAGQLSVLAYELHVDAQHTLQQKGWTDVGVFSSLLGTQAICGVLDGEAWIAFRGTEQLRDVFVDLLAIPVHSQHLGFLRSWQSLAREITGWLSDLQPGAVHLTGHSLGGAIALVAALDLANRDSVATPYPLASVVTFAAPRPFHHAAKAAYANATTRVDNSNRSLAQVTTCYEHRRDVIRKLAHLAGYKPAGISVRLPDTERHVDQFIKNATPLMYVVSCGGLAGFFSERVSTGFDSVMSAIVFLFAAMTMVTALQLVRQSISSHGCTRYVARLGDATVPTAVLPLVRAPHAPLRTRWARARALRAWAALLLVSIPIGIAIADSARSLALICGYLACGWLATAWGRSSS